MRLPPKDVERTAEDPFFDQRGAGPFYRPSNTGPILSEARIQEICRLRGSWRLNDQRRPVSSALVDEAMRAVEQLLDEVARLRGDGA